MSDQRLAATRDASFYGSARFSEARKAPAYVPVYHLISDDGRTPQCCRGTMLLDVEGAAMDAAKVPAAARCRRAACQRAWPGPGLSVNDERTRA